MHLAVSGKVQPQAMAVEGNTLLIGASNSLVADHLQRCGYEYSVSVFFSKSGLAEDKIKPDSSVYKSLISGFDKENQRSFLVEFLREVAEYHRDKETCDVDTQTSLTFPSKDSFAEKLQVIDDHLSGAYPPHPKLASLEMKLNEYKREIKQQLQAEMHKKKEKIKPEEKRMAEELAEFQNDVERTCQAKSEALLSEKMSLKRIQRHQEPDAAISISAIHGSMVDWALENEVSCNSKQPLHPSANSEIRGDFLRNSLRQEKLMEGPVTRRITSYPNASTDNSSPESELEFVANTKAKMKVLEQEEESLEKAFQDYHQRVKERASPKWPLSANWLVGRAACQLRRGMSKRFFSTPLEKATRSLDAAVHLEGLGRSTSLPPVFYLKKCSSLHFLRLGTAFPTLHSPARWSRGLECCLVHREQPVQCGPYSHLYQRETELQDIKEVSSLDKLSFKNNEKFGSSFGCKLKYAGDMPKQFKVDGLHPAGDMPHLDAAAPSPIKFSLTNRCVAMFQLHHRRAPKTALIRILPLVSMRHCNVAFARQEGAERQL
ncbi:LOW QUALITY PROTEIN: centriole and centriolar satellite protein OFD1-like [Rhynchonycteris naso]